MKSLHRDGLRFLNSDKELPGNNFYFNLNNFLWKHLYHRNTPELEESSLSKENKELSKTESFRIFRKKHFKNTLMDYLNINCLRNKIIDLREIVKHLELDYVVISETKN